MTDPRPGQYRLDRRNECLWRGDAPMQLQRKPFLLLWLLLANPERLLTKREILDRLWPGLHVSEGLVREYIHDLRRMLGDDPARPAFIETVRGRGYRYLGGIDVCADDEPSCRRSGPVRSEATRGPAEQPTVAVLPFADLSATGQSRASALILAQGVVGDLSRFRELSVIAWASSCRFRRSRSSPSQIGLSLQVRYLVAGSVRPAGERIRVGVELIDTSSERTLWSECLIIRRSELLCIRRGISGAIASRLGIQIETDLFKVELARPSSNNVRGLVLRARALMREFSCSKNAKAMRLLQRALQSAPDDSSVHRTLARLHTYDWLYGWTESPERSQAAGVDCARRAILCDPLDARAFAELGVAYLHRRQIDEAVAEFDRAVALNPNDADVLVEYSDALKYAGKGRKALSQIRRAMRLNPYYPDWYLWYMADAYDCLGRSAEVVATARRMQNPQEASRLVAANLSHLGEIKDARAMANQVLRAHPEFRVGAWRRRQPWQNRESAERFFEGMRRAGLPE